VWLCDTDTLLSAVEFATVGQTKDGKIYHHLWGADEITALLKQHGLAKAEDTET
jgi:20S proteasome subunit alpha 3